MAHPDGHFTNLIYYDYKAHLEDVGEYQTNTRNTTIETLSSQEADIIYYIKDKIGLNQVSSSSITFAPN